MILVTGGAGYIGSHTAISLIEKGTDIVIFDNLETGHIETIEALQGLSNAVKFVKGDLRNFEDINKVFKDYEIDAVVHFAANSLVNESVVNPEKYYYNNVFGSMNLFKAMIENNAKKIVFSSTCAVYGEPVYMPIDELHPKNPVTAYGASKLMIERILKDYDSAYGLKSIRLRYFNVVGADKDAKVGEWHDIETHLVPNILKSTFKKSESFKIFGDDYDTKDGTCIRDYVNVEDLAQAHLLALELLNKTESSEVFNLGTTIGNSVKEVFDLSEQVLGQKIEYEICPRREGDPDKLFANANKAKNILGWEPKNSLDYSVQTAYEWEKKLQRILN